MSPSLDALHSKLLQSSSRVAAAFALLTGCVVLVGWIFQLSVVTSIIPGLASMKVNTAIGFGLSGLALWMLSARSRPHWQTRTAQVCAAMVLALGVLSASQDLAGWNLGIDELLLQDSSATPEALHPGRMSPGTALYFSLLGSALLFMELQSGLAIAQVLALMVHFGAAAVLVNYAFDVNALYRIFTFSSMALHTAVNFLFLSGGLLTARINRGLAVLLTSDSAGGVMARRLLPVAVFLPVLLGWLRLKGETAGLFEASVGLAIFSVANMVILSAIILWNASSLHQTDEQRQHAMTQLVYTSEQLQLLDDLVSQSTQPFAVTDLGRHMVSFNRAFESLTGYSTEELQAMNLSQLTPPRWHDMEQELYAGLLESGVAIRYEMEFIHDDGSQIPVELAVDLYRDDKGQPQYFYAFITDISERLRSKEMFRLAVESAPNGMVMVNDRGIITLVNSRTESLFGYKRGELLGQPVEMLVPENSRSQHPLLREQFFAQPQARSVGMNRELYGLRKDGTEFPIEVGLNPIQSNEGLLVLSAVVDITARKKLDEERRKTTALLEQRVAERTSDLQIAIDALEQSNLELQQFAFMASHDLQSPLRGISGFVQLLQKRYGDELNDEARDWIKRTVDGTHKMQTLIRDLLSYSRVEGRTRPFEPVSLSEVLDDVMLSLQPSIEDSNTVITRGDLPVVSGDRSQLVQLMQNLIGNSIKYRGPSDPQIHVAAEQNSSAWTISVHDNGLGIDSKHFAKVFEIFRRMHTEEEIPGTGIGLAICRRVVIRHGGKIWVESEPGRGSIFRFTIPMQGAHSHEFAAAEPAD